MFCLKKNTHTHFKNQTAARAAVAATNGTVTRTGHNIGITQSHVKHKQIETLKMRLLATIEWKKARQFIFSKNHLTCGSRYVFQYLLRKGSRACCRRCCYIVHVVRLVYSSLSAQTNKKRLQYRKSIHRISMEILILITVVLYLDVSLSIYLSPTLLIPIASASKRFNQIHCRYSLTFNQRLITSSRYRIYWIYQNSHLRCDPADFFTRWHRQSYCSIVIGKIFKLAIPSCIFPWEWNLHSNPIFFK